MEFVVFEKIRAAIPAVIFQRKLRPTVVVFTRITQFPTQVRSTLFANFLQAALIKGCNSLNSLKVPTHTHIFMEVSDNFFYYLLLLKYVNTWVILPNKIVY